MMGAGTIISDQLQEKYYCSTSNGAPGSDLLTSTSTPPLYHFSSSNLSRLPSLPDLLDPDDFDFQAFFNIQQPADQYHPDIRTMPEKQEQMTQQRPPLKRDRHSKIMTARGVRDRRMRLSLEVAKKFFGLQDLLGYEKASKTVEWLLLQANAEIIKLSSSILPKSSCSSSSTTSKTETDDDHQNKKKKLVKRVAVRSSTTFGKAGGVGKMMRDELRAKARERAKARTIAKKHQQSSVRTSTANVDMNMMMMINILGNINNYHQHNYSSPHPHQISHDGLISSFGQSWEAS